MGYTKLTAGYLPVLLCHCVSLRGCSWPEPARCVTCGVAPVTYYKKCPMALHVIVLLSDTKLFLLMVSTPMLARHFGVRLWVGPSSSPPPSTLQPKNDVSWCPATLTRSGDTAVYCSPLAISYTDQLHQLYNTVWQLHKETMRDTTNGINNK